MLLANQIKSDLGECTGRLVFSQTFNAQPKGNWTTQMTQKVNIVIDGKSIEMPVLESTEGLNVVDVRGLISEGMFTYDPGFLSTASCDSKVTYIDGDKGILLYRGYPIEQLAKHSSHLEVSYLLSLIHI